MKRGFWCAVIFTGIATLGPVRFSQAQEYPTHPIRLIVGYGAGGGTDMIARLAGAYMAKELGQPIVVENKPGAGGNIATEAVARAPADGYTLLLAVNNVTINPYIYKHMAVDIENDLRGVSIIANSPIVLVTNSSAPFKNLAGMIDYARAHPGKISYGTPGIGTPQHLAVELLMHMTGIKMTHIPYKGSAQSLSDLLAGHIPLVSAAINSAEPFIAAGKLQGLAVADPKRVEALKDVPSISEAVPGYDVQIWYGLMAPKKTPDAIVRKLNEALARAVTLPGMAEKMRDQGYAIALTSPHQMDEEIKKDLKKWGTVIRAAGIQPQ
ncbi:tripartite tricarboxylate transporter substrate binding protein [Paralcaligenes sp. KSB-10]|uniref:Bug family tripartite tricarboxylate transporter substrate binding protein n=1 Tax=Paralcaligenes sp. KSB-10 TaxID=2901142 RepID=UPI001E2B782C|nr:tripartite tricarboxylate transporter substrate binding protein [Paralcaligenes sp. KSB-10]UHL63685.1 tripartite tricarboxylate transporter substrate binding protein [Paralcaligenes sp. KSB-10]